MGRDVMRGALVLPEDDDLAEMYARTRDRLATAGYEQYEVSNWAKPGHESRHNLTYWRDGEWIGIGAGARRRRTRPCHTHAGFPHARPAAA
jgi:oxygen-independent coproporphyrinogen-3 oxidase